MAVLADATITPRMSLETLQFGALLDAVASRTPTPGGGAVSAAVGAIGASLAGMVVAYSLGKKSLSEHQAELGDAADRLRKARALLLALAEEDERAYGAVNELMKLPEDDRRRRGELPEAALAATRAPLSVMAVSCDLLRLFERLGTISNRHLRSDLAIAAVLADAACHAGRWNVRINLPLLRSLGMGEDAGPTADGLVKSSGELRARVEAMCA